MAGVAVSGNALAASVPGEDNAAQPDSVSAASPVKAQKAGRGAGRWQESESEGMWAWRVARARVVLAHCA